MRISQPDKLHNDAVAETEAYLSEIASLLDKKFGEGYARNNPQMLAAMVQACTHNFAMAFLGKQIDEAIGELKPIGEHLIALAQGRTEMASPKPHSQQPANAGPRSSGTELSALQQLQAQKEAQALAESGESALS